MGSACGQAVYVVDPDAGPLEAASPGTARVEALAAYVDQRVADNVSENETNSHGVAFETWLREQPRNRGSTGSDETDLREVVGKR